MFILFAIPGLVFASWVSRTPAIKETLGLSTSDMGVLIFSLAAGALTGLILTGPIVARKGARFVIVYSSTIILAGFFTMAMGAALTSKIILATGLIILGCGYGAAEVALNVEGSALEKRMNKTLLPAFHGFYSVGTFIGALIGVMVVALHIPIVIHFSVLAACMYVSVLYCVQYLPENTGMEQAAEASFEKKSRNKGQRTVWREKRTILIGVMVLGMAFAEGSANDWLPLIMVDGYGATPVAGSFTYGLFVGAMTVGRFLGGWILDRYGRIKVLYGCALSGALGLAIIIWSQSYMAASLGVILWGLGASLGFPVGLSAAGDEAKGAAARVGAVATMGYIASLVGPPVLGILGERFGLLHAMIVVLIGIIGSGILTRVARPPQTLNIYSERGQ